MLTPKERAEALLSRLNVEIRVNAEEIRLEVERAIEHAMLGAGRAERERCAKICEEYADDYSRVTGEAAWHVVSAARKLAYKIRKPEPPEPEP
jgi:hypothetical protein